MKNILVEEQIEKKLWKTGDHNISVGTRTYKCKYHTNLQKIVVEQFPSDGVFCVFLIKLFFGGFVVMGGRAGGDKERMSSECLCRAKFPSFVPTTIRVQRRRPAHP